jgi:hypothetical protein
MIVVYETTVDAGRIGDNGPAQDAIRCNAACGHRAGSPVHLAEGHRRHLHGQGAYRPQRDFGFRCPAISSAQGHGKRWTSCLFRSVLRTAYPPNPRTAGGPDVRCNPDKARQSVPDRRLSARPRPTTPHAGPARALAMRLTSRPPRSSGSEAAASRTNLNAASRPVPYRDRNRRKGFPRRSEIPHGGTDLRKSGAHGSALHET